MSTRATLLEAKRGPAMRDSRRRGGTRASATNGQLLELQRTVGNRAVARLLSPQGPPAVQRCGCESCACDRDTEGDGPAVAPSAPAVQRVGADFEVKGKAPQAAREPDSIFFDRDSFSIDGTEKAKLDAFKSVPLSTVTLKGYASEDESIPLASANQRLAAVAGALKVVSPGTGDPVKLPDISSGVGQLDYRGIRRVEILKSGAVSAVPSCGGTHDIDCGPSPNPFDKGYKAAMDTLLPEAFTALASPNASPAKEALALFGGPAQATAVKNGLKKVKDHFPNMAPAIPIGDDAAAGHRCVNDCEANVLASNHGSGPTARMTLGPQYFATGDVIRQGLILIHEASHGADGLNTGDRTYDWQRLLQFIPAATALDNADSFTRFVQLIHDPAAPSKGEVDTAPTLPASKRRAALEAMAWLEQWVVQGRLELRELYATVNRARHPQPPATVPAWLPRDVWYRDNTMKNMSTRFGVTAPPAMPSADDQAVIAGVYDHIAQLRYGFTGSAHELEPTVGAAPSSWDPGPGTKLQVSPAFLALGKKAKVEKLLAMAVEASPFIETGRRAAYVKLVKDMSVTFGGP